MNRILNRREVFRGKVVSVEEVDLDFSSHKATFELINFSSITGVSALPIDDKGNLVLLKHYQLGLDKEHFGLVTGGLSEGENPKKRIQAELQEEAGFKAGKLTLMCRTHPLPGYIGSIPGYLYLAEDLSVSKLTGDEDYPIEVIHLPLKMVLKMIKDGEIIDSRTILAVLYFDKFFHAAEGDTVQNFVGCR